METATPATLRARSPWLRRLGCAVITLLIPLALFLLWLFWPITPSPHSLLAQMPADMSVGVEIRSASMLWESAQEDGLLDHLLSLPIAEELRTSLRQRGQDLDKRVLAARDLIDQSLAEPAYLSLVSRSLTGSLAFATTDTRAKDSVILARLDRFGMLALRSFLYWKGESQEGLPAHVALKKLYLTESHGLLVAATSRTRLLSALTTLADQPEAPPQLCGQTSFPPEGLILLFRPNQEIREALGRHAKSQGWLVRKCAIALTRTKRDLLLRVSGYAHPYYMREVLKHATDKSSARNREAPDGLKKPIIQAPIGQLLWGAGYLAPEISWMGLSRKLWGKAARPRRGISHPTTVLAWEWLDQGVVTHADGRFSMSLASPPRLAKNQGVPPAPALSASWGIQNAKKAHTDFQAGLRAITEYYATPGGSMLYEKVRSETRLEITPDGLGGKVHLHPLFFNHMAPAWGENNGVMRFSTYPLKDSLRGKPPTSPTGTLGQIQFGWALDDAGLLAMRAFLEDKIVMHGFVPEADKQARAIRGLTVLTALARSLPRGHGHISLLDMGIPIRSMERFPFQAEIHLHIGQ